MPFEWTRYASLAEWLEQNAATASAASEEAAYRSSVSRAYYVAFHAAMGLLATREGYVPTRTGEDHVNVMNALLRDRLNRQPRIQIGTKLQRLKRRRGEADYEANTLVSGEMARACLQDMRQLLQVINTQ